MMKLTEEQASYAQERELCKKYGIAHPEDFFCNYVSRNEAKTALNWIKFFDPAIVSAIKQIEALTKKLLKEELDSRDPLTFMERNDLRKALNRSTARGLKHLAGTVIFDEDATPTLAARYTSWEDAKGFYFGEAPTRASRLLEHWVKVFERRTEAGS